MSVEDFVGRWANGNSWRNSVTIEVEIVDDQLVVRAIADADGDLANVQDITHSDDELRFIAYWPSSQDKTTVYRLRRSDGGLEVHATSSEVVYLGRDLNSDGTPRWRSGILHVAPGDSAAGSLRRAVRASGRSDNVIGFIDDLSCGPIASDDSQIRSAWWASVQDWERDIANFWKRILSTSDRLVVWFSRHSSAEYAFYLSLAYRLGDRPYEIIDVTGMQLPVTLPGCQLGLSSPKLAVSLIPDDELASLFGTERAVTPQERENAAQCWSRLKSENAPFRIVTQTGLVSAPDTIFDDLLLEQATKKWRRVLRLIGDTMGHNMEPFIQTGDVMLRTRVVALVREGKLVADGDPSDIRRCHVRLPDNV